MHRSYAKMLAPFVGRNAVTHVARQGVHEPYDVFINHRGIDTKRTIVSLLYDHFSLLKLRPFLDNKALRPGDKLFEHLGSAINNSRMALTVFSPTYCSSYFCLHELALIMESKKKVIPIFCDVKPSELGVCMPGKYPEDELRRFTRAVEEAKYTVGLTFDSSKGNWSDVVTKASDIVIENLMEMEAAEKTNRSKTPALI